MRLRSPFSTHTLTQTHSETSNSIYECRLQIKKKHGHILDSFWFVTGGTVGKKLDFFFLSLSCENWGRASSVVHYDSVYTPKFFWFCLIFFLFWCGFSLQSKKQLSSFYLFGCVWRPVASSSNWIQRNFMNAFQNIWTNTWRQMYYLSLIVYDVEFHFFTFLSLFF